MIKMEIVFLMGVIALSAAAPQGPGDKVIAIIKQEFDQQADGSYVYSYETENGIKADEKGTLKKASGPDSNDVIVAQGAFSYTAPDGTVINLNYVADDENGFRPEVNTCHLYDICIHTNLYRRGCRIFKNLSSFMLLL
ncbi:endocuticle structural glycoprotein ABD-4-like [Zerene cesonia]|uniref:endocuticle structural glycoprotein ABD-4-like n=1 Tax=Zerene cesonia TaxID=33412 RepID=UPI0018E524C2|nr:endocuticle structural glycoprotein ABD-4-like [Zerene cesonia]